MDRRPAVSGFRGICTRLRSPDVDGGNLLARLHELRGDPAAVHRLTETCRRLTGHDLRSDVSLARQQGRLRFDPDPYTIPRETYRPHEDWHSPTLRHAEQQSASVQPNIENYARASETRELLNHIGQATQNPHMSWADVETAADRVARMVASAPSFRMLLADVRAGRGWPFHILVRPPGGALQVTVAKRAYDIIAAHLPPTGPAR